LFQPPGLAFQIEAVAAFEHQHAIADVTRRRQPLHQRRDRHHQHAPGHRGQAVQRGDALRNDIRMRRKQIVRQRFPVREMQHRHARLDQRRQIRFQRVRTR